MLASVDSTVYIFHMMNIERSAETFITRPEETATWLVALSSYAAVHPAIRHTRPISAAVESASRQIISAAANGNFHDIHQKIQGSHQSVGMFEVARRLDALTNDGAVTPGLEAALAYKQDGRLRAIVGTDNAAVLMSNTASDFPAHFAMHAEGVSRYGNPVVADLLVKIKTDTEFWIDRPI